MAQRQLLVNFQMQGAVFFGQFVRWSVVHQRLGVAVRFADFDRGRDFGFQHRQAFGDQVFDQLPRQVGLFLVLVDNDASTSKCGLWSALTSVIARISVYNASRAKVSQSNGIRHFSAAIKADRL